jgi:hypothetical protein
VCPNRFRGPTHAIVSFGERRKAHFISQRTRLLTRCPCTMTPLPRARRAAAAASAASVTAAHRGEKEPAVSTGHDTHTNGQVQAKATIRNHTPINKSLLHAYTCRLINYCERERLIGTRSLSLVCCANWPPSWRILMRDFAQKPAGSRASSGEHAN